MRFNLILFVLVLVLVLEISVLQGTRDEHDDEDEVRTLYARTELYENDIGFMKSHTNNAAGLKNGRWLD